MTLATQHITLVTADDWEGLYVNGKLHDENHSLDYGFIFERLGDVPRMYAFHRIRVKDEWMLDEGRLPTYLSQIPEEART